MKNTKIHCPKCDESIDVNEVLYSQLHSELIKEYNAKYNTDKKMLEEKSESLEKERADLIRQKTKIDTEIALGIDKRLPEELLKLKYILREQVDKEKSEELKSYKYQLDEKVKEVKELNKLKADYQKLQREKMELKEKLEAEAEVKITSKVEQERKKIRKDVEEKSELIIAEKEHVIQQLKTQLTEASRKANQGSSQLRGEVMETSLEDYLRQCFPMDTIEEIKKGAKGADSLHFVKAALEQSCGSIYYETKRAKGFQTSWIGKFKEDMRARNADIGVLVTEVYPSGIERLTMKDGIWICSYEEAKGLCFVLRQSLIMLSEVKAAQTDKGGKMEILYEYMVSSEFRRQMEAIVEGFTTLQKNLNSEKRAMEAIWKKREKEIEKVMLNATHIYSSIRGIAGTAVKPIQNLELTVEEEEDTSSQKLISNSKIHKNGTPNTK